MTSIADHQDVRLYFHERLQEAFQSQRTRASKDVEVYLLNLLTDMVSAANAEVLSEPLVSLFEGADAALGPQRVARFRRLGDAALMLYGFFSDALPRRGVDPSYVRSMGGTGYATASSLMRLAPSAGQRQHAHVLEELADRFAELGAVVSGVRDQTALVDNDVVELYARWSRTGSPILARRLARFGVGPSRNEGAGEN